MKTDVSDEQRFIAEVDEIEFGERDIARVLQALDAWLAKLSADLPTHALDSSGLNGQSPLALHADAINARLHGDAQACAQPWSSLHPAHSLADSFDDRAMLLVFGKFNAGKSSFCNFLAERFAAHGMAVQYFYLDGGEIVTSSARFEEGATETTSRLQGVCLGAKLVLLDTPGLHSMTPENVALTQRFIESADGVIWLTSSSSPGQVQELDGLARELHRNKPLLPVLTRSDEYEEDEVDGRLVKVLRNKSATRRALQEADVHARGEAKLAAMGVDSALLRRPVSISVHMAREAGHDVAAAMNDAGFEKLYAALLAMTGPALVYKQRKRAEVALHCLEEKVMGALRADVAPLLTELNVVARAAIDSLETQQMQLADAVWRCILPTLPELLDTHAAARDLEAVRRRVTKALDDTFRNETGARLAGYVIATELIGARVELEVQTDFEDIVVEYASADGPVREVVGVDSQRLHAALRKTIRDNVLRLSRLVATECRASIERLQQSSELLSNVLDLRDQDLQDLKRRLRAEHTTLTT